MLMLETLIMLAGVIFMVRVAAAEGRSAIVWGGVTLALCLGSPYVMANLPFVRIGIVVAAMFILMFAMNIIGKRRRQP